MRVWAYQWRMLQFCIGKYFLARVIGAGVKNVFVFRIVGLCWGVWCILECAVIQRYILRRWQAGAKNVFVCRIVGVCSSIWCCVERTEIWRYILLPELLVQNCLAYVKEWPKSDALTDRLAQKRLCVWNFTRACGRLNLIIFYVVVWT